MNIRAHGVTDVGLVRAQNEDSLVLLPESELYVVADGMGGHNSGEVASQLTISAMKSFYEDPGLEERLREEHQEFRGQEGIPNAFSEYKLLRAVESANMTISTLRSDLRPIERWERPLSLCRSSRRVSTSRLWETVVSIVFEMENWSN